jgi:hypothetical protein
MSRRSLHPLIALTAACGYVSGTSADASLSVSFFGSASTLAPAIVHLQVQSVHRSYLWTGGIAATPARPQQFDPVVLQGGDSLTATAILQTPQGVELARVKTGIRLQSHWLYGLGFQAGGISPSGFCIQPPEKVAIPGFLGDTLFLWSSGIPEDAVC